MSDVNSISKCGHWKHGHDRRGKRSSEYTSWVKMKERCRDPRNNRHANYGAKGIVVCERWLVFANFLADMGPKPSPRYSIDRFPNKDGNYQPGNCRWATPKQQSNNTRRNRPIDFKGRVLNLGEWSKILGIKRTTIAMRLNRGWTVEAALTTPI